MLIYLAGLVIAVVSLFAILRLFSIDKTMKAALTELQHIRRIQGVIASESGLEELLECGECKTVSSGLLRHVRRNRGRRLLQVFRIQLALHIPEKSQGIGVRTRDYPTWMACGFPDISG